MSDIRVFAHGGGVQSTAVLVLSAQGDVDFPRHIFCNVGEDSENPDTLRYIHEVSMPYAAAHGIAFDEIRRLNRDGTPFDTLYQSMTKPGSRQMNIPVRTGDGPPGVRVCTGKWKMDPLQRWLKEHGATRADPGTVGLGISVDEWQRVNNKNRPLERLEFPLIDANLSRADCLRIVADAGLPPPAKSACYFCPLRKPAHWSEMRRDRPDLFERAAALEDRINEGRPGRPKVFLARGGAPLRSIGAAQDSLFDQAGFGGEQSSLGEEGCDEGRCWV